MVESTVLICILEVLTEEINCTVLPLNGSNMDSRRFVIPHVVAGILLPRSPQG
jgi:hypothetical protein